MYVALFTSISVSPYQSVTAHSHHFNDMFSAKAKTLQNNNVQKPTPLTSRSLHISGPRNTCVHKVHIFFISSYQYEDIWRYNAVYILICNILGYVHARFFWIVCFIVMLQMFLAVYVYIYIHQILIAHAHTHMCIYICKFKFTETHLLRIIEVVHYVCYMFANNIKGN